MYRHGPSCLEGPISRARRWWFTPEGPGPEDREIRHDLVERVRAEIAAGTYDTPERWEQALDRLYLHLTR